MPQRVANRELALVPVLQFQSSKELEVAEPVPFFVTYRMHDGPEDLDDS